MKKVLIFFMAIAVSSFAFASSETPLAKSILKSVSKCTVTAYGTYHYPNGNNVDVSCTKSASSCAQAQADAANCRDLNVCNAVRSFGLEPSPTLNCPKVSEFENP